MAGRLCFVGQLFTFLTLGKGTLLENFLTKDPEDFKGFMRSSPFEKDENFRKQAYRYAKVCFVLGG